MRRIGYDAKCNELHSCNSSPFLADNRALVLMGRAILGSTLLLMLSSHESRPDPHDPSNRLFTEEHTIQSRSVYIQLYVIRMEA